MTQCRKQQSKMEICQKPHGNPITPKRMARFLLLKGNCCPTPPSHSPVPAKAMTDAAHVRDALARFSQVEEVTDAERDLAFANLQKAAKYFDIQMNETDWRQFGSRRA